MTSFDLDTILQELGQFGKFQVKNYVLIAIPIALTACFSLNYIFTAGQLEYRFVIYINILLILGSGYRMQYGPIRFYKNMKREKLIFFRIKQLVKLLCEKEQNLNMALEIALELTKTI